MKKGNYHIRTFVSILVILVLFGLIAYYLYSFYGFFQSMVVVTPDETVSTKPSSGETTQISLINAGSLPIEEIEVTIGDEKITTKNLQGNHHIVRKMLSKGIGGSYSVSIRIWYEGDEVIKENVDGMGPEYIDCFQISIKDKGKVSLYTNR